MVLVPLVTEYPNGFCPPMVAVGPQSLSRIHPLVWSAAWKNTKRCKFCARAQHVQCTPQVSFLYNIVMPLPSYATLPSLVSLAQLFTNSEDPMFKKFFLSGTCCLCRKSPGMPKAPMLKAHGTTSALLSLEACIAHERCLVVKIVDFIWVDIRKSFCISKGLNLTGADPGFSLGRGCRS